MAEDYSGEIEPVSPDLKKYRLAGFGFLALNVLYILIALWKMPPVDPMMKKKVYSGLLAFITIALILTPFIIRGKKLLVQILAGIYGIRSALSIYSLVEGGAFPGVPFLLPCVILTFYLLGRAAWDWP